MNVLLSLPLLLLVEVFSSCLYPLKKLSFFKLMSLRCLHSFNSGYKMLTSHSTIGYSPGLNESY